MPVFCDSPMAIKAVEIYLKYEDEYTDEARTLIKKYGSPLEWPGFTFASTPEESKKINGAHYPSIIISSSGMVTGGRVLHHLAQRLPDPKNTVIFIGFQAPGTRGFTIKSGAKEVKIFGDFVPIRAQIAILRAIQRSCGSTGTARVVAHLPAEAERDLPRSWRDRRLVAVARYHGKRTGMECAGRGVDGESAGELRDLFRQGDTRSRTFIKLTRVCDFRRFTSATGGTFFGLNGFASVSPCLWRKNVIRSAA